MATTSVKHIFLDTNVLVNSNVGSAPLYQEARQALQLLNSARITIWISRQVLREYMVVVTRPQVYAKSLPNTEVVKQIRIFETQFRIAVENETVFENLLKLLERVSVGGKQIHDANIVATMQANNIDHILTLNGADFNRFSPAISVWSLQDVITRYTPPT